MTIEDILTRSSQIEDFYTSLIGRWQSVYNNLKSTENLLSKSKQDYALQLSKIELSEKSIEIVKLIVGEFSKQGVEKLQGMLTYGLQAIFTDKNYSMEIDIADRGDLKTADFYLVENINGEVRKTTLRDSVGGGIQVTVSLILRIYFIIVLNLRRILIMDEALKELSSAYIPQLFEFLHQVVKDLHFNILWVTHDSRFLEYADKVYEVKDGSIKERV